MAPSAAAQNQIGFEHKGIGAILAHNQLVFPLNQREYAWEGEHVRELLEDFTGAINNERGVYFLGTIVLTRGESDVPEVSDGQQRLATTTILLAAIRDYFHHEKDLERAHSIENEYLKVTDLESTKVVPKLQLNVDDNDFFTRFIVACPSAPERKSVKPVAPSHSKIKDAAEACAEHIRTLIAPFGEGNPQGRAKKLIELVKFIKDGAQVISLKVPDHLNAFIMFETLNDRGVRASQADLVKNELLKNAGHVRMKEAQQKWAQMLGVLQSLGRDDEITIRYLHHFVILRNGITKEREVLKKVKAEAGTEPKAMAFVEQLQSMAIVYAALFNSDHTFWNPYGTGVRHNIATMNRDLRVEQIRPLMFAIASHFPVKQAQIAFKLLVFWSVRFLIVGGRGGLLDRNYSLRAREIALGEITTANKLAEKLSDILPSDKLFETAFSEARVSQGHLARYYLRALEQKHKGRPEPEFVPQDDEKYVNLEHVLPDRPQDNWPDIDAETAEAVHRRIGNMAILQATKNSILGNMSFAEKAKVLKDSTFDLTSSVASFQKWGVKEINKRQAELAALAVKTWPLKICAASLPRATASPIVAGEGLRR